MKEHPKLNKNQISGYFRANVGNLIINTEGLVLAAERKERPGAWQLPQGGINQEESEEAAALREMREEIGLSEDDMNELMNLLGTHTGWFAYQLPEELWSEKNGRGQTQKFFAYRFLGQDEQLDEKFEKSEEFSSWKWVRMADLIEGNMGNTKIRLRSDLSGFLELFNLSKLVKSTTESFILVPCQPMGYGNCRWRAKKEKFRD